MKNYRNFFSRPSLFCLSGTDCCFYGKNLNPYKKFTKQKNLFFSEANQSQYKCLWTFSQSDGDSTIRETNLTEKKIVHGVLRKTGSLKT